MEIKIEHLSKSFGNKKALDDVTLVVGEGMFGLLGKNGAGKTTLMRILTTLLNKTEGQVDVCGIPIGRAGEIRKIVGYLPQEFSVYPKMKVGEALDYLGILSGMEKKERREACTRVLEEVNLSDCRNMKVKALSGGMKRRLGIAQAILHNPKVLIVDEPTAGLDPQERIRFRNLLCEIASNRIVMLSTHIVEDIQSTCENIALLDHGKLWYQGSVQDLIESAKNHVFTATVARDQVDQLKKQYILTGMTGFGNDVNVRLLAEGKPFTDALLCEPTMEDAYMLCIGKKQALTKDGTDNDTGGVGYDF